MTRLTSLLLKSLPVVAIYLLFLSNVLPVPLLPAHISAQLLPVVSERGALPSLEPNGQRADDWHVRQIPWVFLVAFGAYALASLGWGLITFRDCPEAHYELLAVSLRIEGVMCTE